MESSRESDQREMSQRRQVTTIGYMENYLEAYSAQDVSPHPDIGRKRHNFADVKRNNGTLPHQSPRYVG